MTDYGGFVSRSEGRLTESEAFILMHVGQHGEAGYPVLKVGSKHWSWQYLNVSTPVCFPTKKEAVASFEIHLGELRDKLAGRV